MKKAFNWLTAFVTNYEDGLQLKRLIAVAIIFSDIQIHREWVSGENILKVLEVDYIFIGVLTGLILVPQLFDLILKLKGINTEPDKTVTTLSVEKTETGKKIDETTEIK